VRFTLDAAGRVTTTDGARAEGGANRLTIITHSVEIVTGDYPGRWHSGAEDAGLASSRGATLRLPPTTCTFSLDGSSEGYATYSVAPGTDIADPSYTLNYLFQSGKAPPAPGNAQCGPDPTGDDLLECINAACRGR